MIDKETILRKQMEKRVKEEVSIHSQLKHPSVLELYTYFEDEHYVYLVLELAQNGQLQKYMEANKITFTEEQASQIFKPVLEGLKYLHSHYIIHRDMTLSNLLLTKDLRVKIADFGLATKLSHPNETRQTMCGTPSYISPEVVQRTPHGLGVDVWGLGCMLYTLLVGKPPFDTKIVKSTFTRVVNVNYHFPDHLSHDARDLIDKLLQKDPNKRIHLEDIFYHPFMNSKAIVYHKNQSGHDVESGIGTMTTGSKQETIAGTMASHSNQARIRSRSVDRCESIKTGSGHRRKFQNLLSIEAMSPMSPNFLPSRQANAYCLNEGERVDTSGHSRRAKSPHESVRSNSRQCCGSVKSVSSEHGCQCRTCGLANEGLFSQCSDCRTIQKQAEGWSCSGHCSRRSKCCCENESSPLNCVQDTDGNEGNIVISVIGSEKRLLTDISDRFQEPCVNRDDISDRMQPCGFGKSDMTVNNIFERDVNTNGYEKRDLDIVPLNVPPLCSDRVKPIRKKISKGVISILETGEVCYEILKKGSNKVVEVCRISSDGLRVLIYPPNHGKGVALTDHPPPVPSSPADVHSHSYHSLPLRHHKKYIHAERLVRMVRAKTPKVTYYSDMARCILMENSPNNNFEVFFYSGGKVSQVEDAKGVITRELVDPEGKPHDLNETSIERLSPTKHNMWQHFQQVHKKCITVEKALEQISTPGNQYFPIIIGTKPSRGKENNSPSPSLPMLGSFDSSTVNSQRSGSRGASSQRSHSLSRTRTVNIPNIGVATQKPSGELRITYQDGSELSYHDVDGISYRDGKSVRWYRHSETQWLPDTVRHRLKQLPDIMRHFIIPTSNKSRPIR